MAFNWNASSSASTASSSLNAGSAVGPVSGLVETGVQHALNERSAERSFDRQKQLLRQEYDYNQMAQRNAVRNTIASATDAGVNPVGVLNSGGFTPAGASASGAPSASVARPDLRPDRTIAQADQMNAQVAVMQKQLDDLQASIDLKKSQKDNVDADTDNKNLNNDAFRDANQTANENMREHLEGLKQLFESLGVDTSSLDAKIDDIDKGVRVYTQGALRLNSEFEKYRKDLFENIPRYEQVNFDYKVAEFKKNNPKIAEAVATLPINEQDKFNADILKIYAEAYKLQTGAQLDAQKIDEIQTNIKSMVQRMKSEYLSDPRLMLADEDYAHFASWLGMDVYEKGMSVLQSLIQMRSGQLGAEKIQQMKDAPYIKENFDKTGAIQGGQRTYKEALQAPSDKFKQKPARKKRRR